MSFVFILSCVLISIILIVLLTSAFKYNTFVSMLIVSLVLAIIVLPVNNVLPAITQGFGDTMKSIGIIIILGTMIGVILDKTGATISMASAILKLVGEKKSGLAIGMTGFITGIPIFCDSGFIVLSGINKSLVKASRKPMLFMATMLAAGLYSVHCLIPPHPGAMAAAGIIKPDIGNLIMLGLVIAVPTTIAGFVWARFITRKEVSGSSEEHEEKINPIYKRDLPGTFLSFMPVIVPLMLLTLKSVMIFKQDGNDSVWIKALTLAGSPEIALLIGVFLALSLFRKINIKVINGIFYEAIEKAGPILVLTAAGGVFGSVIKATGIGMQTGTYLAATGLGLFIPFVIAAFLKTAQGSSTVAIMTAASIVAPMLTALHLDSEAGKLLATLSMGAGSMIVSHANDSYFWVVAKFSELEAGPTLRAFSSATFIMGITAFLCVLVASVFML
jgi:GntP family gluconate:H+ symporter